MLFFKKILIVQMSIKSQRDKEVTDKVKQF